MLSAGPELGALSLAPDVGGLEVFAGDFLLDSPAAALDVGASAAGWTISEVTRFGAGVRRCKRTTLQGFCTLGLAQWHWIGAEFSFSRFNRCSTAWTTFDDFWSQGTAGAAFWVTHNWAPVTATTQKKITRLSAAIFRDENVFGVASFGF